MRPLPRTIILFGIACGVTSAVWWAAWPRHQRPAPVAVSSPVATPAPEPWTKLRTTDLILQLESATTNQARLHAANRLGEIPAANLAEALELTPLVKDHQLTLAAKVLLIHWATADGDAACRWAWQRFRSDGMWQWAFREMGPSWAGRHPQELEKWAIQHYAKSSGIGTISLRESLASEEPILDFEMLSKISQWLIHEDPRAAFKVLQARGGFSTDDRLPESLQTVEEIRHALLAFDHLDEMTPNRFTGAEIWAQGLLARWWKIDPDDFKRSPYSGFFDSKPPDQAIAVLPDDQSPAQRQSGLVRAFDEWTQAHPGERPDTSGWTPVRIQAWEDLEALKSPASP